MGKEIEAQAELDLRGIICPYNFVKTKLQLDAMKAGDVLAVVLDDGEPIKNVPQSISNEGHTILIREPHGSYHRIWIQKGDN